MFPIGDDQVRGASPGVITIGLIVLNALIFVFEATLSIPELEAFITQYGTIPAEIVRGQDWYTLLTSMFLHGGWFHLIGNMLFLWVFGDNIEAVLGKIAYLVFYLLGGLGASLAHIFANVGSSIPSVGASGAIAAVLGAYIVMFPHSRVRVLVLAYRVGIARITALMFIGLWAVTQFFNGIASLGVQTAQTDGVAWWAHIGGFAVGLAVGFLLRGRAARMPLQMQDEPVRIRSR